MKKKLLKSRNTPVVFINYNRPDLTLKVFKQIKKFKPKTLFLICDGPRSKNDLRDVNKVRNILNKINWKCKVIKKFAKKNLGNKKSVEQAFDLVFFKYNFDKVIYLEDDSLPGLSFFNFCEKNLEKYKNAKNIVAITGQNEINYSNNQDSYFFSYYPRVQGFATWKRVWKMYEKNIFSIWKKNYFSLKFFHKFNSFLEYVYFSTLFNYASLNFAKKTSNVWDSNFFCSILCKMQDRPLSIIPRNHLCSNIGYNHPKGDHNKLLKEVEKFNDLKKSFLVIKKIPNEIKINDEYDKKIFSKLIFTLSDNFFIRLKQIIMLIVRFTYSSLRVFFKDKKINLIF